MPSTLCPETTVGRIATDHPLATRVFARHGIDFCCGGGRPLHEVCAERGLDTGTVLAELEAELRSGPVRQSWADAPLAELIDHIVTRYHRRLDEELPRLEAMARKVLGVHRAKSPEVLPALLETFVGLKNELFDHMADEEQRVFPALAADRPCPEGVAELEHEHETAGAALRRLRALTDDYRVPDQACTTWRALWKGLEQLEAELHHHIHLENNILFPKARAALDAEPADAPRA